MAGLFSERRSAAIGRRSREGRTDQPSLVRMAGGDRRYFLQDAGAPPGAPFRESVSDGPDGGPGNGNGVHDGATRYGEIGRVTCPVTVNAKYQNIIKSGDIFRYQPIATITIPTSVGMDIAATFSTGDLDDEIMIGE